MSGSNLPPGVTESMIPGNRPWDIEMEQLWDELDGTIIKFLNVSDRVDAADIPDLLRDLRKDYENLPQTYKDAQATLNKRTKRVAYECAECGCKDLEVSAWVHINTGRRTGGDGPLEGCYCPKCQEFTKAIFYSTENRCRHCGEIPEDCECSRGKNDSGS